MARYWYAYIVPTADPRLASSYQLLVHDGGTPRCNAGLVLCAINSPSGGLFPFSPLSINLQSYIAAALTNGVAQPEGAGKFYVYMKN